MPSGISHMLFSRYLPLEDECDYRYKLRNNTRYFLIGSIAPDLPYASIADDDFLEEQSELSNLFHFTKDGQDPSLSPNVLPKNGLKWIRQQRDNGEKGRQYDALFWFMVGYASHVIADGICHPFVMDKVGRYEGQNKIDHRVLEMGIDVLLMQYFTSPTGHSIEASYAGFDSFISGFSELKYASFVCEIFTELIKEVYDYPVSTDDIRNWIEGISRLFCYSTGKWPKWFRNLSITAPYVFRQIGDLVEIEDKYLLLEKPKYWDKNFLERDSVHFIDDCLPLFNKIMITFLNKAYEYVYKNGPLSEESFMSFSLDTGREVADFDNINIKPVLWKIV